MIHLKQPIVIAIDGHSSCGKSSFAKTIASELEYLYIDSGAMYRAVTLFALNKGIIREKQLNTQELESLLASIAIDFRYNPVKNQYETCLNGENVEEHIRSMEVSENVSEVSKIKSVRTSLVKLQQKQGEKKGIVMDGRDIGTVVFPNAEIKLYMTASLEVRALRRYKELTEKGVSISLEEVKANLSQRDFLDENRTESPLSKASDAIILDNSEMTPSQQMTWFLDMLKKYQQPC